MTTATMTTAETEVKTVYEYRLTEPEILDDAAHGVREASDQNEASAELAAMYGRVFVRRQGTKDWWERKASQVGRIEEMARGMREGGQVHMGYTEAELKSAFALVRDARDWKAPIDRLVSVDRLSPVIAAIQFYTATQPEVIRTAKAELYRVKSDGYRMGPAGDH